MVPSADSIAFGGPGRCGHAARLALLAALAASLAGCRASLPRDADFSPPPTGSSAELCEYIGNLPYVTAEAAYRSLWALHTGTMFEGDFAALEEALAADRLIDRSWGYGPDDFVHRASVGYMLCRACRINLGVDWWLTGSGRYAWRELQYRGIARTSAGEWGLVSGGEFLGLLARAEDHLHRLGRAPAPRAELGAEPR